MNIDFEKGNIKAMLLQLAAPMIVAYLVQALYNIYDSLVVSLTINSAAFAALGIIFPIQLILSSFSTMFGNGGGALISIYLGEHDQKTASKIGLMSLLLGVVSTLVFSILTLFNIHPIIAFFGGTPETIDYAVEYLSIIILGMGFVAVNNVVSFFFRSQGLVKQAMTIMVLGTLVNIILNPILIVIFKMGVAGSAYATIIAQGCSMLYALYQLKNNKQSIPFSFFNMKDFKRFGWDMTKLGFSSFIGTVSFCVVVIISNIFLAHSVDQTNNIAAFSAIIKINELIVLVLFGLIAGLQPIVGFNYGAQNYQRVNEAFQVALKIIIQFTIVASLLGVIFPQVPLRLFNVPVGDNYMRISFIFFVFSGIQIACSQFLQAINRKNQAALVSLSRHIFLFIPIVFIADWILGQFLPEYRVYAVFIAMTLADLFSGIFGKIMVDRELKQLLNN